MSFLDRLREAAYTSPSGVRLVLQFDDVERSGGKKAAIHELPQQDVADVQDLGNQAERYPMDVYFTGSDCDQAADALWAALSERGDGLLQHPRYGDIPVLPLTWSSTERFVEGVGRAGFRIEFMSVQTSTVFPVTATNIAEAVGAAVDAAGVEAVADSADQFAPENAADQAGVLQVLVQSVQGFGTQFAAIVSGTEELAAELDKAVRDFSTKIDELIADPSKLFETINEISKIPALSEVPILKKIQAYLSTIESVSGILPETIAQATAAVHSLLAVFGASTIGSTIGTITTRSEAVLIVEQMEAIQSVIQQAVETVETIIPDYRAPVTVLAELIDAANAARASIMQSAYGLKTERRVTLSTERTPLDMLAEFYGDAITDLDASLDEFIATNDLQGDEILLIPGGREVVYYV